MQRTKTILIAAATLLAAVGGFVVADEALASDWKDYRGSVTAGYAYFVPTPKGTEAIRVGLVDPSEDATAGVAIFDAKDKRVGYYALDDEFKRIEVKDPAVGAYVVYVYNVKGAGVAVSYQNDDEKGLELMKLKTHRNDREIGDYAEAGSLSEMISLDLEKEPLFVSLLYQGSVENLHATVEGEKGEIVKVEGESGTAYAPGLWSSLAGTRSSSPDFIGGTTYTVKAHADGFQGTLYLTTVGYERVVAAKALRPVNAPDAPDAPSEPVEPEIPAAALKARVPYALDVPVGTSEIILMVKEGGRAAKHAHDHDHDHDHDEVDEAEDGSDESEEEDASDESEEEDASDESDDTDAADEESNESESDDNESAEENDWLGGLFGDEEEDEDASDNETEESGDDATEEPGDEAEENDSDESANDTKEDTSFAYPGWESEEWTTSYGNYRSRGGLVSVFAPDDSLVAVASVDDDSPVVVPVGPGEYVIYLWHGSEVAVAFRDAMEPPELRKLEMEFTRTHLGSMDLFGFTIQEELDFESAPLGLTVVADSDDVLATDFSATFESEAGEAGSQQEYLTTRWFSFSNWREVSPENLVPGIYTIEVRGSSGMGDLALLSASYVRDATQVLSEDGETEEVKEDASARGLPAIGRTLERAATAVLGALGI